MVVRLTFGQVKDLSTLYTISATKKFNARSSCMFLEQKVDPVSFFSVA